MPMPNYAYKGFRIIEFVADPGVFEFANKSDAEALLIYKQVVDGRHVDCRTVEVLDVKPGERVVLPKSFNGPSKVTFAGPQPVFQRLDCNGDLVTVIPEKCCVRVEFVGCNEKKKTHVKYFTSL